MNRVISVASFAALWFPLFAACSSTPPEQSSNGAASDVTAPPKDDFGVGSCAAQHCTGWTQCNGIRGCIACGQPGTVPCTYTSAQEKGCEPYTVDVSGICTICGIRGQPACTTTAPCDDGLSVDRNAQCVSCGTLGAPACDSGCSDPWTTPSSTTNGTCVPCGSFNPPELQCAKGAPCAPGGTPDGTGHCEATPCGGDGEPVCPNGKCTGDNNPNIDWEHEATQLLCSATCGHMYEIACLTHPDGASGTPTWEFRCVDGNKFPGGTSSSDPGGCVCYPTSYSGPYSSSGIYYCDSGPSTGICIGSAKASTLPSPCN